MLRGKKGASNILKSDAIFEYLHTRYYGIISYNKMLQIDKDVRENLNFDNKYRTFYIQMIANDFNPTRDQIVLAHRQYSSRIRFRGWPEEWHDMAVMVQPNEKILIDVVIKCNVKFKKLFTI